MAQGEVAHDLQEDAQGHRRDAEAVVSDSSHGYEPGNDDRGKAGVGQMRIDALHRSQPEESNKEE